MGDLQSNNCGVQDLARFRDEKIGRGQPCNGHHRDILLSHVSFRKESGAKLKALSVVLRKLFSLPHSPKSAGQVGSTPLQ